MTSVSDPDPHSIGRLDADRGGLKRAYIETLKNEEKKGS
jgi:hypothetical protein